MAKAKQNAFFRPVTPSKELAEITGLRQRHSGFLARPIHVGFRRSAMLLTGLGFESGIMLFKRSGKPQIMDCRIRSRSCSLTTIPGRPGRMSVGMLKGKGTCALNSAATSAALLVAV